MSRRTMLSDLEIDEVSTVDRPANQHGLITFSKRYGNVEKSTPTEEDLMPLGTAEEIEVFDDEGAPVDPDALEHGALVYDAEGNEYMYAEEEDPEEGESEVGKGWLNETAARGYRMGRSAGQGRVASAARGADDAKTEGVKRLKRSYAGNKRAYQLGGATAAGVGAGGVAYSTTKKSLGNSVLEELSKAVTEDDRSEIIAKAMDQVEIAKAQAADALSALEGERDLRLEREFISKADEYNLPVDPADFGPVLKRLVERMDEDDLEILDAVFKSSGDLLYQEYGNVGGGSNSSIIDSVDALAGEMVAKAGGNFSTAEAQVALFEANPEAYDAYIQEGR